MENQKTYRDFDDEANAKWNRGADKYASNRKDSMSKPTYYKDAEAKKHDAHCYVHVIDPKLRTLYSCNCDQRERYRKEFKQTNFTSNPKR